MASLRQSKFEKQKKALGNLVYVVVLFVESKFLIFFLFFNLALALLFLAVLLGQVRITKLKCVRLQQSDLINLRLKMALWIKFEEVTNFLVRKDPKNVDSTFFLVVCAKYSKQRFDENIRDFICHYSTKKR